MRQKKLIISLSIIGVLLLIVVVLQIIIINNSKRVSDLEEIKIKEVSQSIMTYLDDADINNGSYDKYILYALEYSYNENDSNKLSYEEIKNIVESKFNVEITDEKLEEMGITPVLFESNVTNGWENKEYYINKSNLSQSQIAEIPIIKYGIKEINKKKNKYIVKYDRYIIENPYDVLNYYNDNEKEYDTSKILNYLTCKGKIKDIKNAILEEDIDKIGKKDKQITVTYIMKNNNLVIDNIK